MTNADRNAEYQRTYRERMFAAGYKVRVVWVKREPEKGKVKLTRRIFLDRLGEMTADWTDQQLSVLYGELLKHVKDKKEKRSKK